MTTCSFGTWQDALRQYPGQPGVLWLLHDYTSPLRDKLHQLPLLFPAALLKKQAGLCASYAFPINPPRKPFRMMTSLTRAVFKL